MSALLASGKAVQLACPFHVACVFHRERPKQHEQRLKTPRASTGAGKSCPATTAFGSLSKNGDGF
jgi:hypothetical protein